MPPVVNKGFAGIPAAAQAATAPQPAQPAQPMQPQTPPTQIAPDPNAVSAPSPYDTQDGEDPDAGHAHLMHDIGTAIQQMMAKDPETNKSMTDLMEQFMGQGIDYNAESQRLRGLIQARKTPKAPNWLAAGVGSFAGGPEAKSRFEQLQDTATQAGMQKQKDMESLESNLLNEHINDLRARGKTKENLLASVIDDMARERQSQIIAGGRVESAKIGAQARLELQDRNLGAAEERVRMQIAGRKDIADKDRTTGQVLNLYRSLLSQSQKDITGATKPTYTAEEAMDLAMNTVLPKVKEGVDLVKRGPAGKSKVAPEVGAVPQTTPAPAGKTSKFSQWKAQQATVKK